MSDRKIVCPACGRQMRYTRTICRRTRMYECRTDLCVFSRFEVRGLDVLEHWEHHGGVKFVLPKSGVDSMAGVP